MSELAEIETVAFAGSQLDCVQDGDGEVYVSLRRACEGLGINHASQHRKLKGRHWATVVVMTTVADDGKVRDLAMIDLDTLGMWLATIDANRVNDEAQPKVELYQRECVKVLRQHFFRPTTEEPDERLPVRRRTEYPDGRVVVEEFGGNEPSREPRRETRPERQLPDYHSMDVEVLRERFHSGLRSAVSDSGLTDNMTRQAAGLFYRTLNSELKNSCMSGRSREDWEAKHYDRAVDYLLAKYGLDLRWIFNRSEAA